MINYLKQPKGWEQGIYDLQSYEQYASIGALRSSQLKHMKKSPAHFRAAHYHRPEITPQQQKTFDKGKAFDTLILHGLEALDQAVAVEPGISRRKKEYREWREEHLDQIILSQAELNDIMNMASKALNKKRFSDIFHNDGHPHRVIVWCDKRTGLWCKAEIDWISADGVVTDLKSTADAGFWFFQRNARRLGYANQGAFYLDGLTQVTGIYHDQFQLAAVEKDPPYESHVFRCSYDQINRAQASNEEWMQRVAHCLKTDEWPGYPDEIMDLDSGQYLTDEIEEMEVTDHESIW
jgi:exodeoxyribonuclease VIII